MKRFPLAVVACVMGVTLASCATPPPQSSPPSPPHSPAPTGTKTDVGVEVDTELIDTDPTSCLHGGWIAENSFFLASIREFGDEVQSVSGQVLLRFDANGTLTTEYQDWVITAVTDGMEVKIERVGTDTGTFSATSDTVSIADTDIGSTITMHAAGMDMTIDPHPASYNAAHYSCADDSATIETDDGVLQLSRE
ncbi:MAG: hypothetical protein Q4G35_01570 [Propionibacteriaceae bacterium]|nr:hypothetical protein [Propionibacteriaceae bacterium]